MDQPLLTSYKVDAPLDVPAYSASLEGQNKIYLGQNICYRHPSEKQIYELQIAVDKKLELAFDKISQRLDTIDRRVTAIERTVGGLSR